MSPAHAWTYPAALHRGYPPPNPHSCPPQMVQSIVGGLEKCASTRGRDGECLLPVSVVAHQQHVNMQTSLEHILAQMEDQCVGLISGEGNDQ